MPKALAKSVVTVPSRLYSPDTRIVNLPNLSTDDNGVQIILTREAWEDTGAEVLTGVIEGSNDGGSTWFELTRFGYAGGVMTNPRTHQEVLTCGPTVYWPERYVNGVAVPERPSDVRATITNTVALRTAITLQGK